MMSIYQIMRQGKTRVYSVQWQDTLVRHLALKEYNKGTIKGHSVLSALVETWAHIPY